MKKVILGFGLLYAFIVFSTACFPGSSLSQFMTTRFFFAQILPFFSCMSLGILSMMVVLWWRHREMTMVAKMIVILVTLSSIIQLVNETRLLKSDSHITFSNANCIRIVEWNTEDQIEEDQVRKIFKEYDVDIAVFPELEGDFKGDNSGDRLKRLFKAISLDPDEYQIFYSERVEGRIAPVAVVIKKAFGIYEQKYERGMTTFGTVYVTSSAPALPMIVGVHTAPPLPGLMSYWRRDLQFLKEKVISKHLDAIVVGDFNATLKQGDLVKIHTHTDVLEEIPFWERGTWHARFPEWLRVPIDHILLPKEKYTVQNVTIENLETSDHAAIFVEVMPR